MKYSVIIPVYNAEKTIDRCLKSIIGQHYDDYEIVLVNDGSTDNSSKICKEYFEKYSQIKLVEQNNSGVSVARNNGIRNAQGKYITFVDSDDFVSYNYFSNMDECLKEADYDLAVFSYMYLENGVESEIRRYPFSSLNHNEVILKIRDLLCDKTINPPWAKVYKKEIIDSYGVNFTMGSSISEDRAFNIKYSLHINSLRISDSLLYNVCAENINSLSRKAQKNLDEQLMIVDKDVKAAIKESDLTDNEKNLILEAVNFGNCRVIYKKAKDLRSIKMSYFKRIKEISRLCKENNRKGYTYPDTKFCRRITFPIRWNLAWLIDIMAWKLNKSN